MNDTLFDVFGQVSDIVQAMFPVVFGLLVVAFFASVAFSLRKSDDEKSLERTKKTLLWGVITIFVLVSIWGIIFFMSEVFGTPIGDACPPPQVNPDGNEGVSSCL